MLERMNVAKRSSHIFRQLLDHESWTYTYLLACATTKDAILVDPVDTQVERDLKILKDLGLSLKYAVNTHCHADHITGTGILKTLLPHCKSMISEKSGARADIYLQNGDEIRYGDQKVEVVSTPGHTDGCITFINHEQRFGLTGDTLLIRACGRTDFQQGDPSELYDSVHNKIFSLPDDFHLFPAHDYKEYDVIKLPHNVCRATGSALTAFDRYYSAIKFQEDACLRSQFVGHTVTTVGEEKTSNPRLTKSKEEFIELMKNLGLAYPKKIDEAVPWNLKCGPSQLGQLRRMDGE